MDNPLGYLLAPITIAQFFQSHWQTQFLAVQRQQSHYYNALLTEEDLDNYLQNKQLPSTYINVIKNGESYPTEQWCKLDISRAWLAQHIVDQEKLFNLLKQGATLIINGAHKSIPNLLNFCITLEHKLQIRMQTNIYVTPAHSQGLAPHYDTHDILILQISGRKHWSLYEHLAIKPTQKIHQFKPSQYKPSKLNHKILLAAGDLMYIPRGLVHEASTENEASIHIALGLIPQFAYHLLDSLLDIAMQDPAFREPLPHGYATAQEKEKFSEQFKQCFQHLMQNTNIESLLKKQQQIVKDNGLQSYQGALINLLQIDQLNGNSMVQAHPIDYTIERKKHEITITRGSQTLVLPSFLETTLPSLLQKTPYRISSVQGLLTEQGKIDLIKKCVQAELLRIKHA